MGFCIEIIRTLSYFIILNYDSENHFPLIHELEKIVKTRIIEKEKVGRFRFCSHHPSMRVTQPCPENISLYQFLSLVDCYHMRIRLIGNFVLNPSFTNPFCTHTIGGSATISRTFDSIRMRFSRVLETSSNLSKM